MKTTLYFLFLMVTLSSCFSDNFSEDLVKFELTNRDGSIQKIDPKKAEKVLKLAEKVYTFYIWKGFEIATLTYQDSSTITMRVSDYGAFFYSKELDSFYEFRGDKNRKAWHDLLSGK